jgi:hypothetical protein
VVWNKDTGPGYPADTIWDVYGRLVSPSGPVGSEFPVTATPGSQGFPFVAYGGLHYLVTWTDWSRDTDHDNACDAGEGSCMDTYGRFVSTKGAPVGSVFAISKRPGNQFASSITFDGNRFLVLSMWGAFFTTKQDCNVYGKFVPRQHVSIKATDPDAAEEGQEPGAFKITRVGETGVPLTVKFSIGGTASNGADYQALPNAVIIPAGSSSVTVPATPIEDTVPSEGNETVIITISKNCSYVVGSPSSAAVSIADNE